MTGTVKRSAESRSIANDRIVSDLDEWNRVATASDPDAFAILFDRHAKTIYNYAFRRCGDWSMAEETVAVTFLEAWRKRGGVELEQLSARPWLLGVATNVLRNFMRARRRYRAAVDRLAGWDTEVQWDDDEIAARLDAEQTAAVLRRAIGQLPKRQQDVVWLCLVEEHSYGEASEALGIAVGTVRSRLSRARSTLRSDGELERFWRAGHDIHEARRISRGGST
jgi:RNA polymerase sigma-70 factor (ECF subfamily)